MRVLQVLHTDERGGILTLASMVEAGLVAHGCRVETQILFRSPDRSGAGKLADAFRMAVSLLHGRYDALIAYQTTASILVGLFGWIKRCPVRLVHQTADPGTTAGYLRLIDKIAGSIGLYTANVVNTRFTLNLFSSYPAAYRRRIVLNEHGIAMLPACQERQATRAQFAIPQSARVILNVGRLVDQKNQAVIVKALRAIPDCVFVIAGHGDGTDKLMTLAVNEGVAGRLHLLGARNLADIANLYVASDVFVFPSHWETFGLAAAEAAISGIAMIVSDIAVFREVLAADPSPVVFVQKDDVGAWAMAIENCLDHPPGAEQRKVFARQIAERYSVPRMIDRYCRILGLPVKGAPDA